MDSDTPAGPAPRPVSPPPAAETAGDDGASAAESKGESETLAARGAWGAEPKRRESPPRKRRRSRSPGARSAAVKHPPPTRRALRRRLATLGDDLISRAEMAGRHAGGGALERQLRAEARWMLSCGACGGELAQDSADALLDCAALLPVKTSCYATLVGLLNVSSSKAARAVVGLVLAGVGARLAGAFAAGELVSFGLLVRFVGELHNAGVVTTESVRAVVCRAVCIL
jgi:hypothetical protein